MANPLKQLAGETAIYGFSSILARILNFLFVPIYTRTLSQMQYGVVTEFMAYIAILQVLLVLGLETGCFRFANKEGEDPRKVYSGALIAVIGLNLAFLACMVAFSGPISAALGYAGYKRLIVYISTGVPIPSAPAPDGTGCAAPGPPNGPIISCGASISGEKSSVPSTARISTK